jgi:hypothetical protein
MAVKAATREAREMAIVARLMAEYAGQIIEVRYKSLVTLSLFPPML